MSNFFNAIGVADMEKVHSAMIAWILDDKNDSTMPGANTGSSFSTFDLTTRSHLLCDIFGEPRKKFDSIETFVEWNDIDILILTEDQNKVKECWVIENKLKSQEHESKYNNQIMWQTEKYEKIIANDPLIKNFSCHYLLLSLIGEQAKSQSKLWKSGTYGNLKLPRNNSIIQEYTQAIGELNNSLNVFLKSYQTNPAQFFQDYSNVMGPKMKKSAKTQKYLKKLSLEEKYIIENGLETIFQKSLLIKQMEDYKKNNNNPCHSCNYITSASSNGTAILDILYGVFTDTKTNEVYHAQIEFQNGSFKVQIHQLQKKYNNLSKQTFSSGWTQVFNNVERNYKSKGWLVNPIKNRLYISISKKVVQWQKQNIQSLWSMEFGVCCQILTDLKTEFNTQHKTRLVP